MVKPFTLRLPPSLARLIRACAKAEGISVNAWIVRCLEQAG